MEGKILVDGAIATKAWRGVVGKALKAVAFTFGTFTAVILTGLLWLVSLGHVDLVSATLRYLDRNGDKYFPT